jgi:hypothetical protein
LTAKQRVNGKFLLPRTLFFPITHEEDKITKSTP